MSAGVFARTSQGLFCIPAALLSSVFPSVSNAWPEKEDGKVDDERGCKLHVHFMYTLGTR
jgi:hypothetical protein